MHKQSSHLLVNAQQNQPQTIDAVTSQFVRYCHDGTVIPALLFQLHNTINTTLLDLLFSQQCHQLSSLQGCDGCETECAVPKFLKDHTVISSSVKQFEMTGWDV